MTDPNALRVETSALVSYGRERYEDSVVYQAATRYLADIGAIPAGAWGTLPVSDQLRRDWATALENRLDEAVTARDELQRVSDALLQVATDYGYEPYVPPPAVVIPPDNDRLLATRHETLPSTRVGDEPVTADPFSVKDFIKDILWRGYGHSDTIHGGRTVYYEHGEDDRLNEFVQRHRRDLLRLEALVTQLGQGQRLPLSDLILHAWRSSPTIVRNRADLIHSAANTYAELRTNMDAETQSLARYWHGAGADAFGQYAQLASAYLAEIEEQARWLAEEGTKAAALLEGLRNAYAAAGFERIRDLIEAMMGYVHRVTGLFSACSDPEKTFLDAVDDFVKALVEPESRAVEGLARLIKIDEQARRDRPDLGSRGHDVTPFPRPAVGAGVWTDRAGWTPAPNRPAS